MKTCLFCGKQESSAEHIIAHSVWRRLKGGDSLISVGIWDGVTEKDFRTPHRQESFVTRRVCPECNEGWMSDLEAEFLSIAGSLIEPEWPILDRDFVEQVMQNNDVIARWALKTVITANAAGINERSINTQIASDLRFGKLPNFLKVLIGFVEHREVAITIHHGFNFINRKGEVKWRVGDKGHSFDAIFHFNHFAIRAFNGPGLKFFHKTETKSAPIPCFPTSGYGFEHGYKFQTLGDFEGSLKVLWPGEG